MLLNAILYQNTMKYPQAICLAASTVQDFFELCLSYRYSVFLHAFAVALFTFLQCCRKSMCAMITIAEDALHNTALHNNALHNTALHNTALHCTAPDNYCYQVFISIPTENGTTNIVHYSLAINNAVACEIFEIPESHCQVKTR